MNLYFKFISELGRRISEVTKDTRDTEFLRQRISVAIQRGNAMACLGTFRELELYLTHCTLKDILVVISADLIFVR